MLRNTWLILEDKLDFAFYWDSKIVFLRVINQKHPFLFF
jgi:hypothetical protein